MALRTIRDMYVTMMPVILAGILNMLFTKTPLYRKHRTPMDGGKLLADGKRVFGDNKTWIGFFGMIVAGIIAQCIWGFFCKLCMNGHNYVYQYHKNTFILNLMVGAAFGFAYVLFELPNSFIKRRVEIPEGKTTRGFKGGLFFIIDQIDSLIGVTLVLALCYPVPIWQFFSYLALGAGTHILVNLTLYKLKIRKNL